MRSLVPVLATLAFLVLVAGLHPGGISFDGLSFLMSARDGGIDYGHALYPPLLRLARGLAPGRAAEDTGRWVSALGGALAFVLLWRRAEREGASRLAAALVAVLFALSTLFWQESSSLEPTSWTIAALLAAGAAAEAYGRRPVVARLVWGLLAFGAALGFHVVSVCALPWLFRRARAEAPRLPRAHLAVLLGAALGVVLLAFAGGHLGAYWGYWSGFFPDGREGLLASVGAHLGRGARLCAEGAPLLLAGLAAASLARPSRRAWRDGAWLGGVYLLAFLLLGKPLVGLLTPALLSAALVVARLAGEARGTPGARSFALGLGFAAGLQFGLSLAQALAWHRAPDVAREDAALLARHLPPGTPLFAGELANHLRYYQPELEVLSLPELWHRAHARARDADPIEVLRQALRERGETAALSSDGAAFLLGLEADPTRLGLSVDSALWIPEKPSLGLFPLQP